MRRAVSLIVLVGFLFVGGVTTYAQSRAIVTNVAPIYLKPEEGRIPLRTAAAGTILRVLTELPEWLQVEFNDPQLGIRVGWVRRTLVRVEAPNTTPMDLSVSPPTESPARAATPATPASERRIMDSGRREAEAASSVKNARGPMRPGYKWTGIALLIAGGVITTTGAVAAEDVCYDSYSYDEDFCKGFKYGWMGLGIAAAGTGAILLGVGNAKRDPVAMAFRGDRVTVSFGF